MTAIAAEIERFNRLSATWWDSSGLMRPLHVVNALRLVYVVKQIASHLDRDIPSALNGLRILDVGCGGAEYLLRVLPHGTHQWSMFVRPEELRSALAPSKLHMNNLRGMRYLPVVHKASWCKDTKVNYIATFSRTPNDNYEY